MHTRMHRYAIMRIYTGIYVGVYMYVVLHKTRISVAYALYFFPSIDHLLTRDHKSRYVSMQQCDHHYMLPTSRF